jgi:acyl dehydratase
MSQAIRLQLNETPKTLNLYCRALFAKGLKGTPKLPTTSITLANIKPNAKKVAQYRNVCGFKQDTNLLPLSFPHLLAFPLHLELMLLKDFPFAVMGMVHIRNEITQHRAINVLETMDVSCHFSDIRKTDKGYDIDIKTIIHITGELVWESISTNLVRKKTDIPTIAKIPENDPEELPYKEFWNLSSDLGRRYALVSGDSNPIHLFSLSAKLFGFKGHIAHGMWSKARVIAALHNKLNSDACKVTVDFKLPIFLPSTVQMNYNMQGKDINFDVRDKEGVKPHMKGIISAL